MANTVIATTGGTTVISVGGRGPQGATGEGASDKVNRAGDTMTGTLVINETIPVDPSTPAIFIEFGEGGEEEALVKLMAVQPFEGVKLAAFIIKSLTGTFEDPESIAPVDVGVAVLPGPFADGQPRLALVNLDTNARYGVTTVEPTQDVDAATKKYVDDGLAAVPGPTDISGLETSVSGLGTDVSGLETRLASLEALAEQFVVPPFYVVPTQAPGVDHGGTVVVPKDSNFFAATMRAAYDHDLNITFENPGENWNASIIVGITPANDGVDTVYQINGSNQTMGNLTTLFTVLVEGTADTDPIVTVNRLMVNAQN